MKDIIDADIQKFIKQKLNDYLMIFATYQKGGPKLAIKGVEEFIGSYHHPDDMEYVIRVLSDYLNIYLDKRYEIGARDKANINSFISEVRTIFYKESRKYNFDLVNDSFTNKEFEELKSKLSDIAESIFEFRNRQEFANEVIYNSVEEIRSELVKNAEKGRVLGKDFVIQQLAGKLIDMTVKGGAGAVLTKMSSQYSELSGKIMALM